uniref:Leucine-rich repeat-containing N-terminal plant-type domain-containing protein n=1 Tax=Paramoeba aestuarina TaxID=180227 RepID=A0A7S4NRK8_9EUKA|mmetsp:Transcript_23836/g.37143  ORF Transcript_23836/g.37143 Transcript_23836/m.37143 type:complete len:258 (+) Transcript_23836:101-874(+)
MMWLVVFLFCCGVLSEDTQNEIDREMNSLIEFYHSTKGESWFKSDNWLDGPPCGDDALESSNKGGWYSLSCAGGRVVAINMPNNNMSGTLPSSLGDFTKLLSLVVSNNQIGGEIPSELFHSSILSLYLNNNSFTGTLNDDICSFPLYNLSFNRFSCPLPTCCTACSPCKSSTTSFENFSPSPSPSPTPSPFPSPPPTPTDMHRNTFLPIWAILMISITAVASFAIFVYFAYVCWHIAERDHHHYFDYQEVDNSEINN